MRWLHRVLARPHARLWIVLVAVLWMLPALTIGYVLDDKFHDVMIRGGAPFAGLARGPLELYELSGRGTDLHLARLEGGTMPWYTAPTFKVNFLRPLSSLTLYLDHRLSPRSAVLGHLDSILWLVLLLIILDRLYRRLMPTAPWLAALALLLCAVDEGHAMSVGWIANRNAPHRAPRAGLAQERASLPRALASPAAGTSTLVGRRAGAPARAAPGQARPLTTTTRWSTD